ncbi:hypothetical protein JCM10213_000866, partial [Rhodosporidiobolus nylandii]
MATRAHSRHQLPVLTGDGSDGFPVEADFMDQMEDYLSALNPKKRAKALMTREMYATILAVLLDPHSTAHATAQFRFWAKRMFRLVVTPTANLVAHENRPVAVKDQIYAILVGTHGDVNHGGRDKTSAQVRRFYSWLPKELVSRFVKMCPTCIAKRRQQQPYLSDAYLPANVNLVPRRVQVNVAPQPQDSDEESPERYEAHTQPAAQPGSAEMQRSYSQGGEYREEGAPAAYDGTEQFYDPAMEGQYFEQYPQVVQQAPLDGGEHGLDSAYAAAYGMYWPESLGDLETIELPQPPQSIYDQPIAQPQPLPAQQHYQDEHGDEHGYQQPQPVGPTTPFDGGSLAAQFEAYNGWQLGSEPSANADYTAQVSTSQEAPDAAAHGAREPSPPAIVEPAPQDGQEWHQGELVSEPASSSYVSVYSDNIPTVVAPPSAPSARRAKPPPLDLGRSSNLYPSSALEQTVRRSATTGVPQLLSPHYRRTSEQSPGPHSAPLQRVGYQYGDYRDSQISPGLASACSTASTVFSTASSYPLTPGTSVDSIDSAGMCPPSAGQWQQDPSQLDEAIRQLLDSTTFAAPGSATSAHFLQPEQQQYAQALELGGGVDAA